MPAGEVQAPGRVNLIGEHIDYHGLPVLPVAIDRRIRIRFRARSDRRICVSSAAPFGRREFAWTPDLQPVAAGDWENYLRAAASAVASRWAVGTGVDAWIASDLPPAAGLASSSALLVAFTLCLLAASGIRARFEELMEILPEGEQFVGTRGGGMDHAAILASRAGCASLIEFAPLAVRHIAVPGDWAFLVAHSLETAEKSGGARGAYNARRQAGTAALSRLGVASYREIIAAPQRHDEFLARLDSMEERDAFLHTTSEAGRVAGAVAAMEAGDAAAFGRLLNESQQSLRDRLRVSSPALDRLVDAALACGALGARLTGAGFGGAIVAVTNKSDLPALRRGLMASYYAGRADFREADHLIDAVPAAGAGFEPMLSG
ncbi:MAG: galactokinase family protein [Bryobacteraceae bacterium]